ncbi:hypothetical protein DFQ27_005261 [Actinomortierella ambigua]|uniref:Kelch repeat-containing protein n=1 Tax=Actinomortierella ambigua TaxID=1343610 RepID=A0A9P6U2U5_9FUNG|nr:hypothetical protein DFQ27_005261 [Actinomortierella ambigua]
MMGCTSVLSALTLCFSVVTFAHAQTPLPVAEPGYVKHGTKFYILGGHLLTEPTNSSIGMSTTTTAPPSHFHVLDLSKPWKASSPAWSSLPKITDLIRTSVVKVALSKDGRTLIAFPSVAANANANAIANNNNNNSNNSTLATGGPSDAKMAAARFEFGTMTWMASSAVIERTLGDLSPVLEPTTGRVFVLGGYKGPGEDRMDMYSFEEDSLISLSLPTVLLGAATTTTTTDQTPLSPWGIGAKAVWSQHRQSLLYFGGKNRGVGGGGTQDQNRVVAEYTPGDSTWKFPATSGSVVSTFWHCVATNDNGTLLFAYGGIDAQNPSSTTQQGLSILDLTTMTWRTAPRGENRVLSACTVAGDHFLVWGGANALSDGRLAIVDAGKRDSSILIFDITMNAWVDSYTPSQDYLLPPPDIPRAGNDDSGASFGASFSAVIAIIALVTIAILAMVIHICCMIRRGARKEREGVFGNNNDQVK